MGMASNAEPSLSAYNLAFRRARARLGALEVANARAIRGAITRFADSLRRDLARVKTVGGAQAIAASERIVRNLSRQLEREIARAVAEGTKLAFRDTMAIWHEAMVATVKSGVPEASLGAIRLPSLITMLAYENSGGAAVWRTLLRGHIENAVLEANAVVRQAITNGLSAEQLALRLRSYVSGSESFRDRAEYLTRLHDGAVVIDLRRVPEKFRGAAAQMRYNALRIAYSELGNARHEAEALMFHADPVVRAVRWTLSANRGSLKGPDECDILAKRDHYGLGKGVYPTKRVPRKPHPFDRCELIPMLRRPSEWGLPKPNPVWNGKTGFAGTGVDLNGVSTTARRRAAEHAASAIADGGGR